jgi:hypothetical protein
MIAGLGAFFAPLSDPPLWRRKKPGYPLVSFLPAAKKDTASIPCAANKWPPCHLLAVGFCKAKT